MRVLAINPFHGGSHRAFLSGWQEHSRHAFTNLTLPPYKWKWRMRHGPVTFAEELHMRADQSWDILFCTDMLNLAEFRGLASGSIGRLPTVVYFHENQLTYPQPSRQERDLHYAFTNLTTCLAADAVWFNSAYHRDEFLTAITEWMIRMPDFRPSHVAERIRSKSAVHPPGIERFAKRLARAPGPLRILWVGRWEDDKDPDRFFDAVDQLEEAGVSYRLNILGESFRQSPPCFAEAHGRFAHRIDQWGFVESREQFRSILSGSDVVVSTAKHEFFGIGVLEAVAAGCFPLVPQRLAYPEVLGTQPEVYHDDTATGLARRLLQLSDGLDQLDSVWSKFPGLQLDSDRFQWSPVAMRMDAALEQVRN